MSLDESGHRLFVGTRQPARLLVFDTASKERNAAVPCVGDTDDLFYDARRDRVYVVGGEGFVDTFDAGPSGHYARIGRLATRVGARTGLWSPELDRLFVASPHRGAHPAEIHVLGPGAGTTTGSPTFSEGGRLGPSTDWDRLMSDWFVEGAKHVWRPYCPMKGSPDPLRVARTHGARIVLEDGRELVDGIASWWTSCHGYNHPHIREAVEAQLARAPHVMFGGLAHEPAYRLATRLARLLPGDLEHVFFAESGSVAVEIAMKMALQYWINRGEPGRRRFVSFFGGYHGDTLGTMPLCDPEEGMHGLFAGVMPCQHMLALPRDDLRRGGARPVAHRKRRRDRRHHRRAARAGRGRHAAPRRRGAAAAARAR